MHRCKNEGEDEGGATEKREFDKAPCKEASSYTSEPAEEKDQGDEKSQEQGGDPEGEEKEGDDPEGGEKEGGDQQGEDPEGGDPEGGDPEGGDPEGGDPTEEPEAEAFAADYE